jgi:hypothetical protein
MNWLAVGAIAEAVGVVAIFVSLVYVAIQIRQNTRQISRSVDATRLAAFERNIESGNRIRELLMLHPQLSELFLRGLRSYRGLDSSEKFRFGMLLRNVFSAMQGAYIRQLSVEHDPLEFQGSARVIDEILVNPGAREFLEKNEPDWRPEFREFVNGRLAAVKQRVGDTPD